MDVPSTNVTLLLARLTQGDQQAADRLIPLVYKELRQIAARHMGHERPGHTLQATALVHEAYLKLVEAPSPNWQDRAHFFAVSAQVMRHILVDHARARARDKRGGAQSNLPLEEDLVFAPERSSDLVEIDAALQKLAEFDPRQAKIVDLRFFGGLTVDETAAVLDISPKTVKRDWSIAKAWLRRELQRTHGNLAEPAPDS
jgi:RNA polymerase sigma-70 factor, ECF subfamily